ncbi:hypothetical protein [Pseudaquabacterium rugosum]|uniref:Uncharacterized protein n=1 Tax=Pseudaquabacterium rugosum TaxID=2984194 RepID=A0ABU9BC54_9BURK
MTFKPEHLLYGAAGLAALVLVLKPKAQTIPTSAANRAAQQRMDAAAPAFRDKLWKNLDPGFYI